MKSILRVAIFAATSLFAVAPSLAQADSQTATLYENVRVFNGTADKLTAPMNVLVVGNTIKSISAKSIEVPQGVVAIRIDGGGRTLMPGLTDAHTHLYIAGVTADKVLVPNPDVEMLEKET